MNFYRVQGLKKNCEHLGGCYKNYQASEFCIGFSIIFASCANLAKLIVLKSKSPKFCRFLKDKN